MAVCFVMRLIHWPISMAFAQWREYTLMKHQLHQLAYQAQAVHQTTTLRMNLRIWYAQHINMQRASAFRVRKLVCIFMCYCSDKCVENNSLIVTSSQPNLCQSRNKFISFPHIVVLFIKHFKMYFYKIISLTSFGLLTVKLYICTFKFIKKINCHFSVKFCFSESKTAKQQFSYHV